tara:strand:+ start:4824 stop:5264 length:441 start_codon:yes stop_codon:yes gene_type:complete
MTVYISELLHGINKAKTAKEKKELLVKCKNNKILQYVLVGTFDPAIEWNYGGIIPEWKKDDAPIGLSETSLFTVMPKVGIFMKNNPKQQGLSANRLTEILTQILESMHPDESEVFIQILKKKLKVKGLTEKLVLEVFPDLYRKVRQ